MLSIPVVIQHRHIHLSAADQAALFGSTPLSVLTHLEHEGQVVYRETVTVVGKRGFMEGIHVLGPAREATQVELSATDAFALGFDPPLRVSGDIARTVPCVLRGPAGECRIAGGVIIPARHLHCTPEQAEILRVKHLDVVTLTSASQPGVLVEAVTVRVHPTYALACHLTEDEAAELWLQTGDKLVVR